MKSGRKLLDTIESPEEKAALDSKLNDTDKAWHTLQNKINEDLTKHKDVADKTKVLDDKIADLEKKLDDQEKKLRSLEPIQCYPEQLEQQQKEANVSKISFTEHRTFYTQTNLQSVLFIVISSILINLLKSIFLFFRVILGPSK